MRLLNILIDKLQAAFPPNRIVVILTPLVFMPLAGSITAWAAVHFPGLKLSEGLVIGLGGAAALGALTLAYKWLDQWQHHENIYVQTDLETQLDSFVDSPEAHAFFVALGTFHGLGELIDELRAKMKQGSVGYEELEQELGHVADVIAAFIADHPTEIPPPSAPAINSPAAEAVPPAAPQSSE
jgi:hypothetical protein